MNSVMALPTATKIVTMPMSYYRIIPASFFTYLIQ